MHLEKNICDNVLGTLMNIKGKNKDIANASRDLMELRLRNELHLQPVSSGLRKELYLQLVSSGYFKMLGSYTLDLDKRRCFCKWLVDVQFSEPQIFLNAFESMMER